MGAVLGHAKAEVARSAIVLPAQVVGITTSRFRPASATPTFWMNSTGAG